VDVLWCETSTPDLEEARTFAEAIHAEFPGKLLAYNCSPSFNWKRHLDDDTIARFQRELAAMGYRFQFVTLAGFHALNASMFELASGYAAEGMTAYVRLQERELELERHGYTATRHQAEVGTGYFDLVSTILSGGRASTMALAGSTEVAQFESPVIRTVVPLPPPTGLAPVRRGSAARRRVAAPGLATGPGSEAGAPEADPGSEGSAAGPVRVDPGVRAAGPEPGRVARSESRSIL